MTHFFKGSPNVVPYVEDQLRSLNPGSPLTMIIRREKSGDFSVTTVTTESLEDIVETLSEVCSNISTETTPAG